ncbi:hypothetical protein P43SY_003849 [Pythium insidiosum]|uniref:Phytanoyl-CoA dioxygenase n=1 Tax=Pythium insidiosum TaxID=114742 RepID=A0AAD5LF32_PYTIN|nr:hypothetical protein P43SY_003849 [Pythium insidiosum]
MNEALGDKWRWIYPNHSATKWDLMKSLPNGQRQAFNVDFRPQMDNQVADYTLMPVGLLLALESDTSIHIYGWNRLLCDEEDEDTITLEAGDMLLFRGDMIHAGASYDKKNVRVHAYLKRDDDEDDGDQDTYFVPILGDHFPTFADAAKKKIKISEMTGNAEV